MELIDELPSIAGAVPVAALSAFQAQLATIATQLDENVNSELALDVLALSWPHVEPGAGAVSGQSAAGPAGNRSR
jgi:hypothetical protein